MVSSTQQVQNVFYPRVLPSSYPRGLIPSQKARFITSHSPACIQAWEDTVCVCVRARVSASDELYSEGGHGTGLRAQSRGRSLWGHSERLERKLLTQDHLVWKRNVTGAAFGLFLPSSRSLPNYSAWVLESSHVSAQMWKWPKMWGVGFECVSRFLKAVMVFFSLLFQSAFTLVGVRAKINK